MSAGGRALALRDVGFTYPDGTRALRAAEFEVRAGHVVGLMGPNGSGKSTLLRLLATALPAGEGEIEWFPGGSRTGRLRRRIAAVFEDAPFRDALSGAGNLRRLLGLRGLPRAEADGRAGRWLRRFRLADRADDPVGAYSHGMRRKLALAEAFASPADLLLLDEPLGGLDAAARDTLVAAVRAASADGRTIVVGGHDAEFFEDVCDRVVFLHRGRTVGGGPPRELVRALERDTVFDVELRSASAAAVPAEVDGVSLLGRDGDRIRYASSGGTGGLPRLCRALLDAGMAIGAVRIREPGLRDVYLAVTAGDDAPSEPREATASGGAAGGHPREGKTTR